MTSPSTLETLPTGREVELAKQCAQLLSAHLQTSQTTQIMAFIDGGSTQQVEIPTSVYRLMMQLVSEIGQGNAVRITPIHAELTTNEAATALNVSRPFLIKLLNEKAIPYRMVGSHRRVLFKDVMDYKRRQMEISGRMLDELAALGQELGI